MRKLILTLALPACVASTSSTQQLSQIELPPNVPATLMPPADQTLAFRFDAVGVQKYGCNNGGWALIAPDAQLYRDHGNQSAGHHYLGPTWEYIDGSTVVGKKLAGAAVDPTAI